MESKQGKLLIAVPTLTDPNFRHAVVFMVKHTGVGALGLILNRPSPQQVSELAVTISRQRRVLPRQL